MGYRMVYVPLSNWEFKIGGCNIVINTNVAGYTTSSTNQDNTRTNGSHWVTCLPHTTWGDNFIKTARLLLDPTMAFSTTVQIPSVQAQGPRAEVSQKRLGIPAEQYVPGCQ